MQWLHKYMVWTPLLGAVAAACSYFGGYRLGAVEFPQSIMLSLSAVGFSWALIFPLMIYYAKKVNNT
jgi:hypothetical protein